MQRQVTKGKRMMKTKFKRVFFPLSLIYLLLGLEIDSPCDADGQMVRWRRLRQIVMAPLGWIYFPFSFLCMEFSGFGQVLIGHLATLVYLVVACSFQLTHLAKCRRIRLFVKKSTKNISQRFNYILLALSCSFFILHIIQSSQAILLVLRYYNYTTGESPASEVAIAGAFAWLDYCFYEIEVVSMSIYFASILLHYNRIRVKTLSVLEFIRSNDKNSILNMLDSIHQDHLEFEGLFNLNPLLWLVRGLCMAVLTIINLLDLMVAESTFILGQSCMMLAFFFIHFIRGKIAAQGERIIESYSRATLPRREISCYLYRSIDRAYNNKFTVWQMFDVDRSLIASYIGTVVTFSVLLVQIQNGALNKEK